MITERELEEMEKSAAWSDIPRLIAEVRRLRREFDSHLHTMEAINQHLGYHFTQPLMNARKALSDV